MCHDVLNMGIIRHNFSTKRSVSDDTTQFLLMSNHQRSYVVLSH